MVARLAPMAARNGANENARSPDHRPGFSFDRVVRLAAGVEAVSAGAERHDLEQAAGHCNVLEEVDELVEVAEIVVERQCRGNAEKGKDQSNDAGLEAEDQGDAAHDLGQYGAP